MTTNTTPEPTADERLAQIRDRNRRLTAIAMDTSAANHVMRDMIDSIGDVQWLLERLAAANERAEKAEAEAERLSDANYHVNQGAVFYQQKYDEVVRERDQGRAAAAVYAANDKLRAERDEARARLAEIGEVRVEWSIRWREDGDVSGKPHTEAEARERAGANPRTLALVRRLVTQWRDAEPADAAQDGRSATETDAKPSEATGVELEFGKGTAGLSEAEDDRDTSAWCWTPNPHTLLHCGLLKNHPMPHRRGERTWTDETGTER